MKKERDVSRHDIGREAFVEEAMKWKSEKETYIYKQLSEWREEALEKFRMLGIGLLSI